jgi:YHS domain-containing protein
MQKMFLGWGIGTPALFAGASLLRRLTLGRNFRRVHPDALSLGEPQSAFDVGVAGPLAGLAVAIPALLIGLKSWTILPHEAAGQSFMMGGTSVGSSILLALLFKLSLGEALESGHVLQLSPLAFAGWLGLLVTALNVLPACPVAGRGNPMPVCLTWLERHARQRAAGNVRFTRKKEDVMTRDPVCGMPIDEKGAQGKIEHAGRTYYFCASTCREKFAQDPKRFVGVPRRDATARKE